MLKNNKRECLSKVEDLEYEIRSRKEYVMQIENELATLKEIGQSRCQQRFIQLTEDHARLNKENR